jgi:hypothetical protein
VSSIDQPIRRKAQILLRLGNQLPHQQHRRHAQHQRQAQPRQSPAPDAAAPIHGSPVPRAASCFIADAGSTRHERHSGSSAASAIVTRLIRNETRSHPDSDESPKPRNPLRSQLHQQLQRRQRHQHSGRASAKPAAALPAQPAAPAPSASHPAPRGSLLPAASRVARTSCRCVIFAHTISSTTPTAASSSRRIGRIFAHQAAPAAKPPPAPSTCPRDRPPQAAAKASPSPHSTGPPTPRLHLTDRPLVVRGPVRHIRSRRPLDPNLRLARKRKSARQHAHNHPQLAVIFQRLPNRLRREPNCCSAKAALTIASSGSVSDLFPVRNSRPASGSTPITWPNSGLASAISVYNIREPA